MPQVGAGEQVKPAPQGLVVYGFVEIALVVIEMSGFASKHEINEH